MYARLGFKKAMFAGTSEYERFNITNLKYIIVFNYREHIAFALFEL